MGDAADALARVRRLMESADPDEARLVAARLARLAKTARAVQSPDPFAQALKVDGRLRSRPHLEHLSQVLAGAVRDVERGRPRQVVVSMPPRSGKSTLVSHHFPVWLLRRQPEWSVVLTSFDPGLSSGWARQIRRTIEGNPGLGVELERDGGAGGVWRTAEGGGVFATSVGGALTGRGARVLIIDDASKDFVEAHSAVHRERVWNWWLSVASTRLEPPALVVTVGTRWHTDDLIGRLLSPDHPGDPKLWTKVTFPAVAEQADQLGRRPGEPLLSPLLEEDEAAATARWESTRQAVGSYVWSALYQQRPAPESGAVFDASWWKFWTSDPGRATSDGRTVFLDPASLVGGRWVDSWDATFGAGTDGSSWVVGQRWVRSGPNRYLIAQQRGRWSFTETVARMEAWMSPTSPYGHLVHERLVEKAANGAAILDVLKDRVAGLKAVQPRTSKENRARAVTPEIESGHVFLPHPADPGNGWVNDLLGELREFPHGIADDQVDGVTQALAHLREDGHGSISLPGRLRRISR